MLCSICLDGGDLVSKGCCCRGDGEWVHVDCVIENTTHRFKAIPYQEWYSTYCVCDVCKSAYTGELLYSVSYHWYNVFKDGLYKNTQLDTMSMYTMALYNKHELDEAIRIQEYVVCETTKLHKNTLGVFDAITRLANMYIRNKQPEKAEPLLYKLLATQTDYALPTSEPMTKVMRLFCALYSMKRRQVRAKLIIEDIIASQRNESANVYNKNILLLIFIRMRRYKDAVELASELLPTATRIYGPKHPVTQQIARNATMARHNAFPCLKRKAQRSLIKSCK